MLDDLAILNECVDNYSVFFKILSSQRIALACFLCLKYNCEETDGRIQVCLQCPHVKVLLFSPLASFYLSMSWRWKCICEAGLVGWIESNVHYESRNKNAYWVSSTWLLLNVWYTGEACSLKAIFVLSSEWMKMDYFLESYEIGLLLL
jgi:hypothetical protein